MKTFVLKKLHIYIFAFICLVLFFLNYIGTGHINVFTAAAAADKYKIRYQQFLQATENLGACSFNAAANIWALGVKERNAAMQYIVLDDKLKQVYLSQLEQTAPYFVTGVSSPWIDSFKFKSINEEKSEITFITASSTGIESTLKAVLHINKKGDYYVINKLKLDKELYPYTSFLPPQ